MESLAGSPASHPPSLASCADSAPLVEGGGESSVNRKPPASSADAAGWERQIGGHHCSHRQLEIQRQGGQVFTGTEHLDEEVEIKST